MQKSYVYKCIKTYIATTKSQGGRFFITLKHGITTPFSHHTHTGKIVRNKIPDSENRACQSYCDTHTEMQIADSCLAVVTPVYSWSFANHFLDLVRNSTLQIQVRLVDNFSLSGSIPWFHNLNGTFLLICNSWL